MMRLPQAPGSTAASGSMRTLSFSGHPFSHLWTSTITTATTPTMAYEIPKVQIASVVISKSEEIQFKKDHPVKQPGELAPGECLVKLEATGVCHTGAFVRFILAQTRSRPANASAPRRPPRSPGRLAAASQDAARRRA
jgi:hypothetical protein